MWRCVDLALTDVSEKPIYSIFRVENPREWNQRQQVTPDPLAHFSAMKMEAIRYSETSVNVRFTQRHTPEDYIL
jgi:hypothetical protein